jgi:hypothetical protein
VWQSLGTNVLGSATPYTFYRNFDGAQKDGVWYPIALAEKMANKELNPSSDPDIYASFNSDQTSWYYGTGNIFGKYDLTSVVLHEIGHGLGITHSYEVSGTNGQIQSLFGVPVVYESFIQNGASKNLVESFTSPSADLATQLTGGNLFFKGPLSNAVPSAPTKLYAPTKYSAGSSVAHLDETTYPPGDINSLMTPTFAAAEVNHNPGPLAMALLQDMGWNNIHIKHTPLANTETTNQDFSVVCKIEKDTAYDASSVKLSYSINGAALTTVSMTATGNADEFSAVIPHPTNPSVITTYYYFISVKDVIQRTFSTPGKLWQQGSTTHIDIIYAFEAGPDTKPPHINHTPTSFVKNSDTQLILSAIISDNIGVQGATVHWKINGAAKPDVTMTNTVDSTYSATLNFTVADGDLIQYQISATDKAIAQNVAYAPTSSTFYPVNVIAIGAAVDSYSNNFNSATTDFFGDNLFSINTPSGFSDGCINTSHPYPQSNPKDSISYVFELKFPIKLKASGKATMLFKEIALVEPGDAGTTWPDPAFYDYVIVEGSKDGGTTWRKLINGYDCRDQSVWVSQWNSNLDANGNSLATANPGLYKSRLINMLSTGYFKEGDAILIRFRLLSDQLAFGWGWAIDDLNIQSTITAVEPSAEEVSVFPNPVSTDYLNVTLPVGTKASSYEMLNTMGQPVSAKSFDSEVSQQQIYVGNLHGGVYLVRVNVDQQVITKKIIVAR